MKDYIFYFKTESGLVKSSIEAKSFNDAVNIADSIGEIAVEETALEFFKK